MSRHPQDRPGDVAVEYLLNLTAKEAPVGVQSAIDDIRNLQARHDLLRNAAGRAINLLRWLRGEERRVGAIASMDRTVMDLTYALGKEPR